MPRLLVDTHALLWWLEDDPALPGRARELLADPGQELLVSIASLWEIAVKRQLGKLDVPDDLPEVVKANGFAWLQIAAAHVWAVRALPRLHGDPFDRLLVAQSIHESAPLVTGDARLAAYGVDVLWG